MATNDNNETSSIVERIKKLLALAGNNSNEQEAALAAERVQELLAKYNLTMATVEAAAAKSDAKKPVEEKRQRQHVKRGAMYAFQKVLWSAVADVNFCLHWIAAIYDEDVRLGKGILSRRPVKRHILVGREVNVVSATLLGEYLEDAISRLCPFRGKDTCSAQAIAWKLGCAERLAQRLFTKKLEMQKASQEAAGTAVVLAGYYGNETESNWDYAMGEKGWYARWKKERQELSEERRRELNNRWEKEYQKEQQKQGQYRRMSAYYEGLRAAENIGLDPQVR